MNSNRMFMLLFILTGGATLWLGVQFFCALNLYFSLSSSAPALVTEWKVQEKREGEFIVEALYQFQLGERVVSGTYEFPGSPYLNPLVAQSAIKELEEKSWTVWYNPARPDKAKFQRNFPTRKGIHFALALGVMAYFSCLRVYLKRLNSA